MNCLHRYRSMVLLWALMLGGTVGCPSPNDMPIPVPDPPRAGSTDGRPPITAVPTDGPGTSPGGGSDGGGIDPTSCPDGQQFCAEKGCVDTTSPEACGRSCAPCPTITGGTATCDGTRCGLVCPAGMRVCLDKCIAEGAPCDDVCPDPKQRLCNNGCVNLDNIAACGPECVTCPASVNGKTSCNGTSCEIACDAGFHLCDGVSCKSDRDPRSCGSSCTPCPVPEGGEATCDGTVCGAKCPASTKLCAGACIPVNQACMGVCPDGKHDCDGNCVPNDVNFCGPSCQQCRAPANADARCAGDGCEFSCRSGFRTCGDGCLANDRPCDGACPGGRKVCGDRCVPTSTCCTGGSEGCPECSSCNNGTCGRRPDGTGCGSNRVCAAGSCIGCGSSGQTCCASSACGGGLVCRQSTCVGCGLIGEPCCAGDGCDGGTVCRSGSCASCGGFGEPCCAGNACDGGGLSCQGGTCRGECTPGMRICENGLPRVCSTTGQWQTGSACNNQACVNGTCQGNCAPGRRGCRNAETPQVCNNSGQFVAEQACQGVCRGEGECVGSCRPTAPARCEGLTRITCDGNGNSSPESCQPRQANETPSCSASGCQSSCNVSPGRCNGSSRCWSLEYGCDECVEGLIWRDIPGTPGGDRVCVNRAAFDRVRQENAEHPANVDPIDRTFGPNTCRQGFVFRDAFPGDEVCVTGASRSQAAAERNAQNNGAVTRVRANPNCPTADRRCN